MKTKRMERVLEAMERRGLQQMIVSSPAGIRYLTDVDIRPGERLFALYLSARGCKLFLNRLFVVPPTGLRRSGSATPTTRSSRWRRRWTPRRCWGWTRTGRPGSCCR